MPKKKKFKIINLSHLCEVAKISYEKVYSNIYAERYKNDTLDFNERTVLANNLVTELKPFLSELGFKIEIKRN